MTLSWNPVKHHRFQIEQTLFFVYIFSCSTRLSLIFFLLSLLRIQLINMDLQSLADFIQQQREELENEKRELLLRKVSFHKLKIKLDLIPLTLFQIPAPDAHPHCQDQDGVVPALNYDDNVAADDSFDQPEQSGKQVGRFKCNMQQPIDDWFIALTFILN